MSKAASPAFSEFKHEQTQINEFLWSSEIAHAIVLQRFISRDMRASPKPLRVFLPTLRCNAFVPPRSGKESKYSKPASVFERHLKRNFEAASKLVIVQIYRAFERFLTQRTKLHSSDDDTQRRLLKYLRSGASNNLAARIQSMGIALAPVDEELHNHFLDAQIYHLVRHDIAHGDHSDAINVGGTSWSDRTVRGYCQNNKNGTGRNVFPPDTTQEQADAAIERVCDGAHDKIEKWPTEPLIFFYALFSLGAYHRLAQGIDALLPPMSSRS